MKVERVQALLRFSIYVFSIGIYLLPISSHRSLLTSPDPILDEVHIVSANNHDANIHTNININVNSNFMEEEMKAWSRIFRNDYWGRDMNSPSSHKSYRPFTVLTFRYVQRFISRPFQMSRTSTTNGGSGDELATTTTTVCNLYLQRVVNVIIHSTIVHMLSSFVPSMLFLPPSHLLSYKNAYFYSSSWTIFTITTITQLLFTLHPTHSEIVVNIANRGHLLSILFLLLSLSIPIPPLSPSPLPFNTTKSTNWNKLVGLAIVYTLGLLSSETFLFYLPIVIVTWLWMSIVNDIKNRHVYAWMEMDKKGNEFELQKKECSNINTNDKKEMSEIKINQNGEDSNRTSDCINNHPSTTVAATVEPIIKSTISVTFTQQIKHALHEIYPQIIVTMVVSMLYLYIRQINDWISIPTALIRRAENPFVTILQQSEQQQLQQSQYNYDHLHPRIKYHVNYIFILCIHVIKSLGMGILDIIGLSHEYGYNCIPELELKSMTIGNAIHMLLLSWKKVFSSSWLWNIEKETNGDESSDDMDSGISGMSGMSGSRSSIGDDNNHGINHCKIVYFDDERIWIIVAVVLSFILLLIRFHSLYDDGDDNDSDDVGTNYKNYHDNKDGNVVTENENNDFKKLCRVKNRNGLHKRNVNVNMNNYDIKQLGSLLWIVFCAWIFASLFPVSGLMRVGTFVADRLVGPSTVITSLFWGCFFTSWIYAPLGDVLSHPQSTSGHGKTMNHTNTRNTFNQIIQFLYRCLMLCTILTFLSIKVHKRNQEWMTSKSLLESSLRICPNNAKSNLEISKIYSGLYYPEIYDLNKALEYLHKVEEIIDGDDYCDVNYQFAFVYFQKQECLKFEERIIKGILCPFTMQGSHLLFQQYWKVMLNTSSDDHELGGDDARRRYMKYVKIIQDAIQKEAEKEKSEMMKKNQENHNEISLNSSEGLMKNEL